MESFSLVCDLCSTVNPVELTHCLVCGKPFSALTSAPTVSVLSNKLLKERYRVLHTVGKGGMGTVYIGTDTQLGNRLVAIKEMIPSGLTFAEKLAAAKRFQQEAHLLAGLQHPHLPGIYDHFAEGQRWYLVMSFIKGQTLETYLSMRGGSLEVAEVVEIGLVLCSVLHYLHTYRPPIIFRDLKPSNIMRTLDGYIYLIDFGIARAFKAGQGADTTYQGTSGYAPPEQYGSSQTTPRSDIYALGATLYHLLTGYEPASTPFNLPPLQSLVPEAPAQLGTLIVAMLELDESKRPQSAELVSRELRNIADDFASVAPAQLITRSPSFLRARKATKLRKNILASSFALAALSVILALYVVISHTISDNVDTSYKVESTFCDAFNSAPSDLQTAYQQLSASYQRIHSLGDFQIALRGASRCMVISLPDTNHQAEVDITMQCTIPLGAPTPPPHAPPPQSPNPVYLTLIQEGDNGWRINTVSIISRLCRPLPGERVPG
jgi:serine/threonine protein kinase